MKGVDIVKIKPEILQLLKDTPNSAYDHLLIEFMYQNNSLENMGFSFGEIIQIVGEHTLYGIHDIFQTHMVLNMKDTLEYMIDTLEHPIDGDMLLTMHQILMDKTWEDKYGFKGCWKQLPNCIIGSDVVFSEPENVEDDLAELLKRWNDSEKTLEDIVAYHVEFERIHPLQGGNGIIGRLLMIKQCIENDVDMILIDENHHIDYMQGLYVAQMYNDPVLIKTLVVDCQETVDLILSDLSETIDSVQWDQILMYE